MFVESVSTPGLRLVLRSCMPLLFGIVASSCSQGPVCEELASCGGSPVGQWAQRPPESQAGTYCQESMNRPPVEGHLQNQLHPVARQRLPEKTHADWCYELVITGDEVSSLKKHNYWWENFPYIKGLVEYNDNGEFRMGFNREAFVDRWYSQTCMRKYGYSGSCKDFEAELEKANVGAGEYNTFNCTENAQKGGCDCNFNIFEVHSVFGRYAVEGGAISHFPASPNAHFSQAALCVQGDTMQLSGMFNSFLWDRPGLRTIELVRVNCEDGVQGPGEQGVDCGRGCPNACPGGQP